MTKDKVLNGSDEENWEKKQRTHTDLLAVLSGQTITFTSDGRHALRN